MLTGADYHRLTGYKRHELGGHALDWSSQPELYKHYRDLEWVELPKGFSWPKGDYTRLLRASAPPGDSFGPIQLMEISRLFALGYGLTAKSPRPGGDFYYRSAPSAGALYPCEVYLAARDVEGLNDGIYHYSIARHALARLRPGRFPSDYEWRDGHAAVTFFITAIFYRSAWKYRQRAYRYHLLDSGHLAENLALAARAAGLPVEVEYDFDDAAVNRMLGLDPAREVCLAVIGAPQITIYTDDAEIQHLEPLDDEVLEASQMGPLETSYPEILDTHRSGMDIQRPTAGEPGPVIAAPAGDAVVEDGAILDLPANDPDVMNLAEAMLYRRSRRNFIRERIAAPVWKSLLASLYPLDGGASKKGPSPADAVSVLVLSQRLRELPPGVYRLDPREARLLPVRRGEFADEMADACLNQEWLAGAALHVCFAADLGRLEELWGPRGYRYAMLTAGRLCQRLYVGATALGLGGCGIGAFYDDEAARILGLNEHSSVLYLMGVGPVKGGVKSAARG